MILFLPLWSNLWQKGGNDTKKKSELANPQIQLSLSYCPHFRSASSRLGKFRCCMYLPTPLPRQDVTQSQFLSGVSFLFRLFLLLDWLPNQGWKTSLPYYLAITGGRMRGLIPFPRVLMLCEMQPATSRIWTRVTMSISYDDNHYTMGTS